MNKLTHQESTLLTDVTPPFSLDDVHELIDCAEEAGSKKVVLVLDDIKMINSSFLGMVAALARNLKELEVPLAITGLSPNNLKLFEVSGMHRIIPVHDTVEDALKDERD